MVSHLIHRAWWRGSDPFPGVSARKNVVKRRKNTFERLHKRENDEERCHDRFCVRNVRCRSLYKLKSSDSNYGKRENYLTNHTFLLLMATTRPMGQLTCALPTKA